MQTSVFKVCVKKSTKEKIVLKMMLSTH